LPGNAASSRAAGILVNAASQPHQGPVGAADWRALRERVCAFLPLRRMCVAAAQQPSDTSHGEMVNFIQGYVEVYSS
jgi:hypothetical protein